MPKKLIGCVEPDLSFKPPRPPPKKKDEVEDMRPLRGASWSSAAAPQLVLTCVCKHKNILSSANRKPKIIKPSGNNPFGTTNTLPGNSYFWRTAQRDRLVEKKKR